MASRGNEREKIELVWICRETDRKTVELRVDGDQRTVTRTVGVGTRKEVEGGYQGTYDSKQCD